jgi:nitrogen fixation protein FixH
MSEPGAGGKGIQGRHVLLALLGFFGAILIVNGVFLYYAVATFGGGDTSSPYQKGLRYNQTIAEDALLAERGWSSGLAYDRNAGRISLQLRDRQDQPVRGLRLDGSAGRPATDRHDVRFAFDEAEPGTYVAALDLGPGQWVVQLRSEDLSRGGAPAYRLKQRLFIEAAP